VKWPAAGARISIRPHSVGLPQKSGCDLFRDLRKQELTTPLLMLTARGQLVDCLAGLKLGADEYLTGPFDRIIGRVEPLLRRNPSLKTSSGTCQVSSNQVGLRRAEGWEMAPLVSLSIKEFRLLRYFVEHRGATLSREELRNEAWGYHSKPSTRTVDVHVA
jgi:DNA-binding response OmpR family regulator